jgi:hypothetical protein
MVRQGVVSVQENWRTLPTQDHASTLAAISRGVVPQILLFRETLVSAKIQCMVLVFFFVNENSACSWNAIGHASWDAAGIAARMISKVRLPIAGL